MEADVATDRLAVYMAELRLTHLSAISVVLVLATVAGLLIADSTGAFDDEGAANTNAPGGY